MANTLKISLAWSPEPRVMHVLELELPQGACVRDALQTAASDARFEDLPKGHSQGIWNRRVPPNQALNDGDRLEIYRPLRVDPKTARRERFKKQGARSAGLFAQRRPGAKPGY